MTSLLRRFSIAQRFTILGLAVAGVLALAAWSSIEARIGARDAAGLAIARVAPLNSALEVLQQLQLQRGMSSTAVDAKPDAEAERRPRPGDTRAGLRQLRQQLEAAGLPWSAQRAEQLAIRLDLLGERQARQAPDGRSLVAAYDTLIDEQLKLLETLVDETGLSHPSDRSTRDLAMAATVDLPRATEALARLRAHAPLAPAEEPAATDAAMPLAAWAADARPLHRRSLETLRRAAETEFASGEALAGALAAARVRGERALELVQAQLASPSPDLRLATPALDAAIAAHGQLQMAAGEALGAQLSREALQARQELLDEVARIAALALVVAVLGAACVRSVTVPMRATIGAARAAAAERGETVFDLRGRDEWTELGQALEHVLAVRDRPRQDDDRQAVDAQAQQRITTQVAEEIAQTIDAALAGDLARRLPLEGRPVYQAELCGRINHLLDSLAGSVRQLRQAVEPLAEQAAQLRQAARDLSTGPPAGGTGPGLEPLQPVVRSLRQIADHAKTAGGWVSRTAAELRDGQQAIGRTVDAMRRIGTQASALDHLAYRVQLAVLNVVIEGAPGDGARADAGSAYGQTAETLAREAQAAAQGLGTLAGESTADADEAARRLSEIGPALERVRDLMEQVASAADRHADTLFVLDSALREPQLQATRRSAALDDLALAAERLQVQAVSLRASIAGGTASAGTSSRAAASPGNRGHQPLDVDEAAFTPF